jgi:phage shock protein E
MPSIKLSKFTSNGDFQSTTHSRSRSKKNTMITATMPYKYSYHFAVLMVLVTIYAGCAPNKIFHKSAHIQQLPLETYLETLEKDTNHYLIDIRTAFEYKKQHLEEATNISFVNSKFKRELNKLDRDKTVFIYCETAHRSPYAAKKLSKMGFSKVIDLQGGYKSYRKKVKNEKEGDTSKID